MPQTNNGVFSVVFLDIYPRYDPLKGYCDRKDLPLPYSFTLCLSILSDVRINLNAPIIVLVCILLL